MSMFSYQRWDILFFAGIFPGDNLNVYRWHHGLLERIIFFGTHAFCVLCPLIWNVLLLFVNYLPNMVLRCVCSHHHPATCRQCGNRAQTTQKHADFTPSAGLNNSTHLEQQQSKNSIKKGKYFWFSKRRRA